MWQIIYVAVANQGHYNLHQESQQKELNSRRYKATNFPKPSDLRDFVKISAPEFRFCSEAFSQQSKHKLLESKWLDNWQEASQTYQVQNTSTEPRPVLNRMTSTTLSTGEENVLSIPDLVKFSEFKNLEFSQPHAHFV